jgi:transcriptional regulator with XRE-family HTH domain
MDTNTTTPTSRRWGAIIRERRELLGMSQYQLADKLDCRQSAVSGWERGRRIPSRRNLALLCDVLGLPPTVFVYEAA